MKSLIDEARTGMPDAVRRVTRPGHGEEMQARKLVVGKDITVRGEITSCDILIVEGTVKADIAQCREMQIAKGGLYIGTASVETAEIHGRFEGELTVGTHLVLRSSGQLAAKVRYAQIEVEAGGDLSGDIKMEAPSKPSIVRSA
ncbi:MAG TPA: polymer-forming cytoskeletal protein [Stellaceae bacterium]|nr:polymer-forming cytoskeletal protein [Stellaceae bacterium]